MSHTPPPKTRIYLVDDHRLFRSGLRVILEATDDLHVLADLEDGNALLQACERMIPDVVLLDLEMPVMDGLDALKALKEKYPAVHVLLLTMHNKESLIHSCMEHGANGYLLKQASPEEVVQAIRQVVTTGYYFNNHVSRALLSGLGRTLQPPGSFTGNVSLTPHELRVLKLICQELTTTEIAEQLHLSPRTVEGYRQKLLHKVNAKNTVGLVVYAASQGLLERWKVGNQPTG